MPPPAVLLSWLVADGESNGTKMTPGLYYCVASDRGREKSFTEKFVEISNQNVSESTLLP